MVNYEQILSARVKEVQPSGIRRFFELAAKMPHAISLGVGEPDFETPWQIRRAGIQSLEKGQTFYTSNWGLAELRNQIAALVRRKYRLCYDADKEILVTVGGSEAIDNTIRAIVNVGDEVLIPEPSFVCYKPLTQMAGGVPVPLPTRAEDQFKLTADSLRAAITPRTKLLILPYPNNPTGAIMTRDELQAIATVIKDTNIVVLSDEIYNSLTYGPDRHVCFAELDGMKERTIVVDGFSKSYAMTGWRLGWAMGPKELMRHICKIHQFGIMSAPTTAQFAGIEAIRTGEDDIERMREPSTTCAAATCSASCVPWASSALSRRARSICSLQLSPPDFPVTNSARDCCTSRRSRSFRAAPSVRAARACAYLVFVLDEPSERGLQQDS